MNAVGFESTRIRAFQPTLNISGSQHSAYRNWDAKYPFRVLSADWQEFHDGAETCDYGSTVFTKSFTPSGRVQTKVSPA